MTLVVAVRGATQVTTVVVIIQNKRQLTGDRRSQVAAPHGRNHQIPDQRVSVGDGCRHPRRQRRSIRHVELGRDQLVGQGDQSVATDRLVQNGQQLCLGVGHSSQHKRGDRPCLWMILPVALSVGTAEIGLRIEERALDRLTGVEADGARVAAVVTSNIRQAPTGRDVDLAH